MGENIKFTALFVKDTQELLTRFPPKHKKIFGHHSTIEFKPENLDGLEIGKEQKIKIIGRAFDEFGDDLLVENPKSKNEYPHITLSRGENAPPLYSKILFEKAINSNTIEYFNNESVKVIEGYSDFNNNIFLKKEMGNNFMTQKYVVGLYKDLNIAGIKIWIDGGFCVDALLEKQLRPHKDLDIAIEQKDVSKLREILTKQGYEQIREDSQWNFVLGDNKGHEIDVHVFVYDNKENIVDGILYPKESLTGNGIIENQSVNCISPKYMVEFLAPWISKWPEKYLPAISEICAKYNIELPKEYVEYKEKNNL